MAKDKEMKWIAIEDKLPPMGKQVLVWDKPGVWFTGKRAKHLFDEKRFRWIVFEEGGAPIGDLMEITHWCEVKEP